MAVRTTTETAGTVAVNAETLLASSAATQGNYWEFLNRQTHQLYIWGDNGSSQNPSPRATVTYTLPEKMRGDTFFVRTETKYGAGTTRPSFQGVLEYPIGTLPASFVQPGLLLKPQKAAVRFDSGGGTFGASGYLQFGHDHTGMTTADQIDQVRQGNSVLALYASVGGDAAVSVRTQVEASIKAGKGASFGVAMQEAGSLGAQINFTVIIGVLNSKGTDVNYWRVDLTFSSTLEQKLTGWKGKGLPPKASTKGAADKITFKVTPPVDAPLDIFNDVITRAVQSTGRVLESGRPNNLQPFWNNLGDKANANSNFNQLMILGTSPYDLARTSGMKNHGNKAVAVAIGAQNALQANWSLMEQLLVNSGPATAMERSQLLTAKSEMNLIDKKFWFRRHEDAVTVLGLLYKYGNASRRSYILSELENPLGINYGITDLIPRNANFEQTHGRVQYRDQLRSFFLPAVRLELFPDGIDVRHLMTFGLQDVSVASLDLTNLGGGLGGIVGPAVKLRSSTESGVSASSTTTWNLQGLLEAGSLSYSGLTVNLDTATTFSLKYGPEAAAALLQAIEQSATNDTQPLEQGWQASYAGTLGALLAHIPNQTVRSINAAAMGIEQLVMAIDAAGEQGVSAMDSAGVLAAVGTLLGAIPNSTAQRTGAVLADVAEIIRLLESPAWYNQGQAAGVAIGAIGTLIGGQAGRMISGVGSAVQVGFQAAQLVETGAVSVTQGVLGGLFGVGGALVGALVGGRTGNLIGSGLSVISGALLSNPLTIVFGGLGLLAGLFFKPGRKAIYTHSFADFDNDGNDDRVVRRHDNVLEVQFQRDGSEWHRANIDPGQGEVYRDGDPWAGQEQFGDVNGDGYLDVVWKTLRGGNLKIYLNQAMPGSSDRRIFNFHSEISNANGAGGPYRFHEGDYKLHDLNMDGLTDILWNWGDGRKYSLARRNGDGSWGGTYDGTWLLSDITSASHLGRLAAQDLNDDGTLDAVVRDPDTGRVRVFFKLNGAFVEQSAGALFLGGKGNDSFTGGDEDHLVLSRDGNDTVILGNGNNYVNLGTGDNWLVVGHGRNLVWAGAGDDSVQAGNGDNVIDLGGGNNQVRVGNGNNRILTLDGDDLIVAGDGTNYLHVGGGNNFIRLGHGRNTVVAGGGEDIVQAGDGDNIIDVGGGNNWIRFGNGANRVVAGDRDDVVVGGHGWNHLSLGEGANGVSLGDGNNTILAGSGDNTVFVGNGGNVITLGNGSNTITMGNGSNAVVTGSGDDRIYAGHGSNIINLGDGANQAILGDGNNRITAGSGNDFASVGDGNNWLDLGSGDNQVYLGDGNNVVTMLNGNHFVVAGNGANKFAVGEGDHQFFLGHGSNEISISGGNTTIYGGHGGNWIRTGDGWDTIVLGSGNDVVDSAGGNDYVSTGAGNDWVAAGWGDDWVVAGSGWDTAYGGLGNDTIFGNTPLSNIGGSVMCLSWLRYQRDRQDAFGWAGNLSLAEWWGMDPSKNVGSELHSGGQLKSGDYLSSPNGKFIAWMQSDGNFVVYDAYGAMWNSVSSGWTGSTILVQGDGGVVMYKGGVLQSSQAAWEACRKSGVNNIKLVMQDDGNLVVYPSNGTQAIWHAYGQSYGATWNWNATSYGNPNHGFTHGDHGGLIRTAQAYSYNAYGNAYYVDVWDAAGWDRVHQDKNGNLWARLNNGSNQWGAPYLIAAKPQGSSGNIRYRDVNLDGRTDVIWDNHLVQFSAGNGWLHGAVDWGINWYDPGAQKALFTTLAAFGGRDLNGDGRLDVLIERPDSWPFAGSLMVLLQNADGDFVWMTGLYEYGGSVASASGLAFQIDYNNDGIQDRYWFDAYRRAWVTLGNQAGGFGYIFQDPNTPHYALLDGPDDQGDSLYGEDGDDRIDGGTGNDVIYGGNGNDVLLGGSGDDWMAGESGNDWMNGQGGSDQLFGGVGDDTLIGEDGNDALYGESGHDMMDGGAGDDYLDGGSGDDQMWGGAGSDTMVGGDGNDVLSGDDGDDTLSGMAGDDRLLGGNGNDRIYGVDGDDLIDGGSGDDVITGDAGADTLHGSDGNDQIWGGAGDDVISGGSGVDVMIGETGDDTVYVDEGHAGDAVDGGAGLDTVVVTGRLNQITVTYDQATGVTQLHNGQQRIVWAKDVEQFLFRDATTSDLNDDGLADLLLTATDQKGAVLSSTANIARSAGDGTTGYFDTIVGVAKGGILQLGQLYKTDLDRDGQEDRVYWAADSRLYVSRGRPGGHHAPTSVAGPMDFSTSTFFVGEMNGQSVLAWVADDGTSQTRLFNWTNGNLAEIGSQSYGDVDGDGKTDMVFRDLQNRILVSRGIADGKFEAPITYQTGNTSITGRYDQWDLTLGDLDGDGRDDLLFTDRGRRDAWWYLANAVPANGPWVPWRFGQSMAGAFDSETPQLTDIDGDGRADLVRIHRNTSGQTQWMRINYGQSDGKFSSDYSGSISIDGEQVVGDRLSGDVNGDGLEDQVFRRADQGLHISLGNDTGGASQVMYQYVMQGAAPWNIYANFRIHVADVNGDGRSDLLSEYLLPNDHRIWLQLGQANGSFGGFVIDEHNYAGSIYGGNGEASLLDLNGDGRADLIRTTRNAQGTVTGIRLLLAKLNGTFEPLAIDAQSKAGSLSLGEMSYGEVNGDGTADALFWAADGSLRIALGQEAGFADPVKVSVPHVNGPLTTHANNDALWGDIDGDGRTDVAFVERTGRRDVRWYRVGATSVSELGSLAGTSENGAAELRDINGDGRDDLIRNQVDAQGKVTSMSVAFGRRNGQFSSSISSVTDAGGPTLGVLHRADINKDGLEDKVLFGADGKLHIARAMADGSYEDVQTIGLPWSGSRTPADWDVMFGDIDGEGFLDIMLVTKSGYYARRDAWWAGINGTNLTTWHMGSVAGLSERGDPMLLDLDGDGRHDLVRTQVDQSGKPTVLTAAFGDVDGKLINPVSSILVDGAPFLGTARRTDVNQDGLDDALFIGADAKLRISLAKSTGGYLPATTVGINGYSTLKNHEALFADINGDGSHELILIARTTRLAQIYQIGANTVTLIGQNSGLSENASPRLEDIDGDGRTDLVRSHRNASGQTQWTRVYYGQSNGQFTTSYSYSVLVDGVQVTGDRLSGDVNGDGLMDQVFRRADQWLHISLGNDTGGASQVMYQYVMQGAAPWNIYANFRIHVADVNGDGRSDLLSEYLLPNDHRIWLQLGQTNGSFGGFVIDEHNYAGSIYGGNGEASLVDINGDGRSDLVRTTRNAQGAVTGQKVLLAKRDGSFDKNAITAVSKAGSLSLGDAFVHGEVNGDGRMDAIFWAADGSLRVALGQADGFADPVTMSIPHGGDLLTTHANDDALWGDIDGDGKTDLALVARTGRRDARWYRVGATSVAGLGSATGISESGAPQMRDFNGDGRSDLLRIHADAQGAVVSMKLYLGQSDGEFGAAIASAARDGQQSLGQVTMADVNGDGRQDSIFNRIDLTASGTLVSLAQADGRFAAPIATGSSWYATSDMFYGDINGDGRADLVRNTDRSGTFSTALGQTNGTFSAWKLNGYKPGWGGTSDQYRLDDLDDDGRAELVRTTAEDILQVARFNDSGTLLSTHTNVGRRTHEGTAGNDSLSLGNGLGVIYGLGGNDTLTGGAWSDRLVGGTGNDTLNGGLGSDIYEMALGSGRDVLSDGGGRNDILLLGEGIDLSDLVLRIGSTDMIIGITEGATRTLAACADQMKITGYVTAVDKPIEEVQFATGARLDLQQLVQAMAGFVGSTGDIDLGRPEVLAAANSILTPYEPSLS